MNSSIKIVISSLSIIVFFQTSSFGADFAGAATCAGCHASEAAAWQGSHHDLAMQEARVATVLGRFDGRELAVDGQRWSFFQREGRFMVRVEGSEQGEYEVAYCFGVSPLQQYLVSLPGGRLQALQVAWDSRAVSQGGQRWFSLIEEPAPTPGDPLHWASPALAWNAQCADCHVTGFEKRFDFAQKRYDSRWAEGDVGCEACHGPGAAHAEWARNRDAADAGQNPGLPVHFSPASTWSFDPGAAIARAKAGPSPGSELDVCAPCHARRSRLLERAEIGAPFLDGYRPLLLNRDAYHDDGQVRQEAYVWGSFVQSRMAEAGVRCSDCHDPHGLNLRAEGNALCSTCHAPGAYDAATHHHHPQDSAGAQCVNCHMREHTFMGVDRRRDHGFHRPRPDLSLSIGTPNACQDCHAERGDAWAAAEVRRWRATATAPSAFGAALAARSHPGAAAAATLLALASDFAAPEIARATALSELAQAPPPVEAIAVAARGGGLLRLAAASSADALPPDERARRIGPLLRDPLRAVRLEAARALADVPDTRLPEALRAPRKRAHDELIASYRVDEDSPISHFDRGLLHLRQGEAAAAELAYRDALRVGDWFAPAAVNLADLLAKLGRLDESVTTLLQSLARNPRAPELSLALGFVRVQQGRLDDALPHIARAAELAPANAYFAYSHAVALHSAGQIEAAHRSLAVARVHNPEDPSLLGLSAAVARDAGQLDEALDAAQRLEALFPGQAEPRALREDIEARLSNAAKETP